MKKKPYQRNGKRKLEERVSQPPVKNVVVPQPVIKPSRLSRGRVFAIGAGLAALVGFGYAVKSYFTPTPLIVNGAIDYDEVKKHMKYVGEPYPAPLSNLDKENFLADLVQNVPGLSTSDVTIEGMFSRDWVVLYESPAEFEGFGDYEQRIDDLFAFVNDQRIKRPKVRLEVPTRISSITLKPVDDVLTIYAVKAQGDERTIKFSIPPRFGFVNEPSKKLFPVNGSTGTRFSYYTNEQLRVDRIDYEPHNIFISTLGKRRLIQLTTIGEECLHRAFAPFTTANIRRHVEQFYAGNPTTENEVPRIIHQNSLFEEGIVHAIDLAYCEANLDKLGLTKDDIDWCVSEYAKDPRYEVVPYVLGRIRKEGTAKVIEEFCNGWINLNKN